MHLGKLMPTIDDIYCKFGVVAEAAQLLETEIGTLLLHAEGIEADLIKNPDSSTAADIYKRINKYTLGRLITNSKSKISSVEKLEGLLSAALFERNRLSHSFYREHNFRLRAKYDDGRNIMSRDLDRMHDLILEAYKAVMLISGIDLENIDEVSEGYSAIEKRGHVKI